MKATTVSMFHCVSLCIAVFQADRDIVVGSARCRSCANLERVEEFDDIGRRSDVDEQKLRQLLARQIAFGQQPAANDQNQHQKLFDDSVPGFRWDLDFQLQTNTLEKKNICIRVFITGGRYLLFSGRTKHGSVSFNHRCIVSTIHANSNVKSTKMTPISDMKRLSDFLAQSLPKE